MDVFDLVAKITLDTGEYEKGLNDASGKTSSLGDKLKTGLGVAAKGAATAITAAAAAVAALTKQAVTAAADYEQLAGGVNKIFDAMDTSKIFQDATNAYKDLGMSANEYLTVANSVGAAFTATLGDEKGYAVMRQGLTAISDYATGTGANINELNEKYKMITKSTSSYQSIADQFSGLLPATSDGFLKQAQAAGFLSGEYTKLTEVPIAEYQATVSAMLEKGVADLNLTGNTAAEALGTLSGSAGMAKAAWQNMVTALASEDTKMFNTALDNLTESASAFAKNLVPVIGRALSGIGKMIQGLVPVVTAELPGLVKELLPSLVNSAMSLINGLVAALPGLMSVVVDVIPTIIDGLLSALPQLATAAMQIITELVNGLTAALPQLIPAAVSAILQFTQAIIDNLPMLLQAALQLVLALAQGIIIALPELLAQLPMLITSIVQFLVDAAPQIAQSGFELFVSLVKNLPAIIAALVAAVGQILAGVFSALTSGISEKMSEVKNAISSAMDSVKALFGKAWELVKAVALSVWNSLSAENRAWLTGIYSNIKSSLESIKNFFSTIWNAIKTGVVNSWNSIKTTASVVWNGIKSDFSAVLNAIKAAFSASTSAMSGVWNTFKSTISSVWNNIKAIFNGIITFIRGTFTGNWRSAWDGVKQIVKGAFDSIKSIVSGFRDIGTQIVNGIRNGISAGWNAQKNFVAEKARSLLNAAKSALGIASPSKKFRDEVGAMMAEGIGVGFTAQMPQEMRRIEDALDISDIQRTLDASKLTVKGGSFADALSGLAASFSQGDGRDIVLSVDGHELARFLAPAMSSQLAFARR